MPSTSLRERTRAVVQLDRTEVTADDARKALHRAVEAGEPVRGYVAAYMVGLEALALARRAVWRVTQSR